jgi:hypothetical protein
MALVGEAHILVRAITTNVSRDIQRGFNGISGDVAARAGQSIGRSFSKGFNSSGSGNIFGKIADGLGDLSPGAEAARTAFQSLMRSGYTLQAGLGILLGGISSLIGGLGALVGSAGAAAAGLIAVAGAAVSLKVGFSIAGLALGGISKAVAAATKANGAYGKSLKELQFDAEDAGLNVDKAGIALEKAIEARNRVADLAPNNRIRREADLAVKEAELALRKAKYAEENPKSAGGAAGQDPYADLTPSQKQFAKYLAGLTPQLEEIKEAVAKGFLPLLQAQMDRLIEAGTLEIIKTRFYDIARGMGLATKRFVDVIIGRKSLEKLDEVLFNISEHLPPLGTVLGNLFDGLLGALRLADPAIRNFITYLETKSKKFADFFEFKGPIKNSGLATFFLEGEKILERFFGVFGNVFKSLSNIVRANIGPGSGGEIMLQWLEKTTTGWANMGRELNGSVNPAFKKFFANAATNTTKILDSIGALVKEFLKLGDMPEIGQAFDILKEGAPAMGELMRASVKAGPALSRLVVELTKIFAALADDGAPTKFFETLTFMAAGVRRVLENDTVKVIMDMAGRILAVALAIGTVGKLVSFFGKVVVGSFAGLATAVSNIIGFIGKIQTFFLRLSLAPGGFIKSIGMIGRAFTSLPVIGWIVAVVSLFVEAYNRSADFRSIVEATIKTISDSFAGLWASLMGLFDQLFGSGGFGGIMTSLQPVTDWILSFLVPILGGAIATIIDVVKVAVDLISSLIGSIMNGIRPIISGIMDLFAGKLGPGLAKIFGGIGILILGIFEGIVNGVIGAINFVLSIINNIAKAIGTGPIGQFLKAVSGGAIDLTKVNMKVDYVKWTDQASKNVMSNAGKAIPPKVKLAEGGVVYPKSGGSMVTVAEAGRPERVEPLHPNGLSDRDIAIINKLSGGQSVNITVNPSAKMNEKELAAEVSRQIAFNIRKGGY